MIYTAKLTPSEVNSTSVSISDGRRLFGRYGPDRIGAALLDRVPARPAYLPLQ